MTPQELLWKNAEVLIVSILSKNKVLHMKHRRLVGRIGVVSKEAKNGMLLIQFDFQRRSRKYVSIPASCLIRVK